MPDAHQAQIRLTRLLEANRLVVEHLDLPTVLRQIVEAATELVGAAYGAIGSLGPDGRLDQFIHVGMDDVTVARMAHPPFGLGLLGLLIEDPRPVRLPTMADDPRSAGLPEHHPPMSSFLGVPLIVRGEIFGHLYLADPRPDAFEASDQDLVEALAATAGVAISHARLFQESTRREQWTAASTQITHELLTNDDADALGLIAHRVLELAEADLVAVVLARGEHGPAGELVVDRAVGVASERLLGVVLPDRDTLVARCLATRMPQLVDEIDAVTSIDHLPASAMGPAMAVPLPADVGVRGSLFVLRDHGSAMFTAFELDLAASFAGQAALALELADAAVVSARARTLEDRDRIARDLHDHVVQRLFAAGLNIQSVCGVLGPGPERERLSAQIDEIDATIRQIRTTIFGLHRTSDGAGGVRAQILSVVAATAVGLPGLPEVTFHGPLDLLVTPELGGDVVAVVRETLTNVGRHASAQRVGVTVTADARTVSVEVVDDGVGPGDGARRSGLANLRDRAVRRGGSFEISARKSRGTRVCWQVPLGPSPRSAPIPALSGSGSGF